MAIARWLVDNSAMNRLRYPVVEKRLRPLLEKGLVATCPILDIEMLFSARSPSDYEERRRSRSQLEFLESDIWVWERAQEVQALLAASSQHRVKIPDLVIAATAEKHGIGILHYDHDFDLIATFTGQEVEWVASRGSVP